MAQVRVFSTLRDLVGKKQMEVAVGDGMTVREVLRCLVADNPALGPKLWDDAEQLTGYINVMLNGRRVQYLSGLDTPMTDADTLSLFAPIGGG